MAATADSGDQSAGEPEPNRLLRLSRLWFGLSVSVTARAFTATGFGLMTFKYVIEALLIYSLTGRFFAPMDFLNPLLSMRQQFFAAPAPDWLGWSLFFWSLPFLWIAVSMSVRRAANAGYSPWLGLLVLMPFVNYVYMLLMCAAPERSGTIWISDRTIPAVTDDRLRSALAGIAISLLISLAMAGVSVYAFANYGATLFMATPLLMGTTSAFLYNRPRPRRLSESLLVATVSIAIAGVALLVFAFEGVLCLAMLLPVAGAMGALGGIIGYAIAVMTNSRGANLTAIVLLLPLLAGAESLHTPTPIFEVVSTVEIDAPPEKVWPHVIGFSDLPDPDPWYFRLGIAYPQRATIVGSGLGAERHCVFSTGPFVEAISVWEPPHRLAFDVKSQPPCMHELSIYRHVHPPHLDGYLRCRRGEFRLIRLDGSRTRLEGRTWYEFEMYPLDYWSLWSDAIIHRIHERVLVHIKGLAEKHPALQVNGGVDIGE